MMWLQSLHFLKYHSSIAAENDVRSHFEHASKGHRPGEGCEKSGFFNPKPVIPIERGCEAVAAREGPQNGLLEKRRL